MANTVYWLGGDGNVYFKDGTGVRNVGKPINMSDAGFDSQLLSAQSRRINDPNPQTPKTPAPTNANGQGGGGTSAPKVDKSNDIALQLAGLGALDGQINTGIGSIDTALGGLKGKYATEAAANEENYRQQGVTNQSNLQKNKQSAMVNAASGRQGLFGTLSSIGALSGSGVELANKAVQAGANADLSGAEDTFGENQSGLDTSINTFRAQDEARKKDAETAAENARTGVRNQAAQSRQSFFSNLADDYAAMGDSGNSKRYAAQAAGEYANIAGTSIPSSNLSYSAAAFTPGALANYLAGQGSTTVSATPANGADGLPGLTASTRRKRQTSGATV